MAAQRGLYLQRPDGLINLFTRRDASLRTVEEPDVALAAMATGSEHGQFWANGDTDIYVDWEDGRLVWILDAPHPSGDWPAELGWWTHLGRNRPPPPLPAVAARARRLPNGAQLVTLLDDAATVDPVRYEDIHRRGFLGRRCQRHAAVPHRRLNDSAVDADEDVLVILQVCGPPDAAARGH